MMKKIGRINRKIISDKIFSMKMFFDNIWLKFVFWVLKCHRSASIQEKGYGNGFYKESPYWLDFYLRPRRFILFSYGTFLTAFTLSEFYEKFKVDSPWMEKRTGLDLGSRHFQSRQVVILMRFFFTFADSCGFRRIELALHGNDPAHPPQHKIAPNFVAVFHTFECASYSED